MIYKIQLSTEDNVGEMAQPLSQKWLAVFLKVVG